MGVRVCGEEGGGEEAGDNQRPKERLEVGAGITIALCGQTLRK